MLIQKFICPACSQRLTVNQLIKNHYGCPLCGSPLVLRRYNVFLCISFGIIFVSLAPLVLFQDQRLVGSVIALFDVLLIIFLSKKIIRVEIKKRGGGV